MSDTIKNNSLLLLLVIFLSSCAGTRYTDAKNKRTIELRLPPM
jgi:hypothetical protein